MRCGVSPQTTTSVHNAAQGPHTATEVFGIKLCHLILHVIEHPHKLWVVWRLENYSPARFFEAFGAPCNAKQSRV